MRINVTVPEAHVSAPVLNAALESVTRLDEQLLHAGELEPFDPEAPQVRWRPEPPGQEHFDHGRLVSGRGHGDCDDLAPWHAATLRATGEDPGAHAVAKPSGPKRWHAVVLRSDGSIDDPSLDAGMPPPGRRGVRGGTQPPMLANGRRVHGVGGCNVGAFEARPHLALRPVANREHGGEIEAWQARTDLPWHTRGRSSPHDLAMASLHASPVSDQALVGSICGALALGEANDVDDRMLDLLRCIHDMLHGASWEECAEEFGLDAANSAGKVVGAFFRQPGARVARPRGPRPPAVPPRSSAALPLAPTPVPPVPSAPLAYQYASPTLQNAVMHRLQMPPVQAAPYYAGPVPLAAPYAPAPAPAYYAPPPRAAFTPSLWPSV